MKTGYTSGTGSSYWSKKREELLSQKKPRADISHKADDGISLDDVPKFSGSPRTIRPPPNGAEIPSPSEYKVKARAGLPNSSLYSRPKESPKKVSLEISTNSSQEHTVEVVDWNVKDTASTMKVTKKKDVIDLVNNISPRAGVMVIPVPVEQMPLNSCGCLAVIRMLSEISKFMNKAVALVRFTDTPKSDEEDKLFTRIINFKKRSEKDLRDLVMEIKTFVGVGRDDPIDVSDFLSGFFYHAMFQTVRDTSDFYADPNLYTGADPLNTAPAILEFNETSSEKCITSVILHDLQAIKDIADHGSLDATVKMVILGAGDLVHGKGHYVTMRLTKIRSPVSVISIEDQNGSLEGQLGNMENGLGKKNIKFNGDGSGVFYRYYLIEFKLPSNTQ